VLFVSHAATAIALARRLLNNDDLPLRVGCCTLSEFHRRESGEDVKCIWKATRLADGSHLKDGALRDWGFEDAVVAFENVDDDPEVSFSEEEEEGPVGSQVQMSSNL